MKVKYEHSAMYRAGGSGPGCGIAAFVAICFQNAARGSFSCKTNTSLSVWVVLPFPPAPAFGNLVAIRRRWLEIVPVETKLKP